jgi:hypothetical protein
MSTSMLRISLFAITTATLAASAGDARADGMFVMPRLAPEQSLSFEMLYGQMNFIGGDLTLISLEGTYRHRFGPRFAAYGNLGLAHGRNDALDGTSLTNLTFGGSYLISRRGDGASALVMSVSLPTASDSGDAAAMAFAHGAFHIADPGRFFPETTTFRVGGDWARRFGKAFFQLEGGVHALFADGDDEVLLRLGVGGGAWVGRRVALVGELTTMAYFLTDEDGEEDFLTTLDAGMRFLLNKGQLGARLYIPLDESTRDADMLGFGVDLLLRL